MLKLGKLTDYAITVLVQLAQERGCASAHALSDRTGIPEPTVAKVLKGLAKGGLVESERGVSGGYRLMEDPSSISIGQVIEAMDGPIAIVSCLDGEEGSCSAQSRCLAKNKWAPVNGAIRDALYAVTLSDMAAPAAPRVYQITGGASHAGRE